ncbi:hypothetical protein FQN54_003473 [Arachnomyces sp. PD_36]|nr:hypothetical protein FQN54_003473 [Arachnomyces sp. PD_36]
MLADPDTPEYPNGLPKVTPVIAGVACDGFGLGNFSLVIDHCTNSTTNEPCDIEGFPNNVERWAGSRGAPSDEGLISFPLTNDEPPKNKLSCSVVSRGVEVLSVQAPAHDLPLTPMTVSINNVTDTETAVMWSDDIFEFPKAYKHYSHEGDRFDGVFLGYDKTTSWAIKYTESESGLPDAKPYYGFRLLKTGEPLREGESATWIKVGGSF